MPNAEKVRLAYDEQIILIASKVDVWMNDKLRQPTQYVTFGDGLRETAMAYASAVKQAARYGMTPGT